MSTAILPSLAGLGFDVTRTPVWDTIVQQSISGKETRIAKQTYPRWKWELSYNVLRSNNAYNEFQELVGFFNARQGKFDTFLYQDADDNSVTGQEIGIGNNTAYYYPLVRSFGGFIEPILAPNIVSNVYFNGVAQTPGTVWNYCAWGGTYGIGGTTDPNPVGNLNFASPPTSGVVITADFSYYFPVRMSDDSVPFTLFLSQYYKAKKFSFISVKN